MQLIMCTPCDDMPPPLQNIEMLTTELEKQQPSQRVKTKVASSGEDSELETVPKTNNEQT